MFFVLTETDIDISAYQLVQPGTAHAVNSKKHKTKGNKLP